MKKLLFILTTLSFSGSAFAQVATPTCTGPVTQYQDNYSTNTLGNYTYHDNNTWASVPPATYSYSVAGNELRVAPATCCVYSFAVVTGANFNNTLSDYTMEGDFKLDAGPGVFGLVFRADPATQEAYIFQWNGMNGDWEIEKKTPFGYDYPGIGSTLIPDYTYGTWVHLKVVVGPGNLFTGYVDFNDGLGPRVVYNGVTDIYTTPPPYTDGTVGLRAYSIAGGGALHIDNFVVYTCGGTVNTPTLTRTPTRTATWTPTPPGGLATATRTSTATVTPTGTVTVGPTRTATATPTVTVTPAPIQPDIFDVGRNVWNPASEGPLPIQVEYPFGGGQLTLGVFNSAGEQVRKLDDRPLTGPWVQSYTWDGKNEKQEPCASGVYIIRLVEPLDAKTKKVLLVR